MQGLETSAGEKWAAKNIQVYLGGAKETHASFQGGVRYCCTLSHAEYCIARKNQPDLE